MILLIMGAAEVGAIQWSWVTAIVVATLTACGIIALLIDDHVTQRNFKVGLTDPATRNRRSKKRAIICTLAPVADTPAPQS